MSWKDSFRAGSGMLRLGVVFMWNGLMIALVAYLTRAWITQEISLEAVGIFGAAFALSGMFINFVLSAMGADYYPRLTAIAHDHAAMKRLVNEQTEIGLVLAVPGLLATLTLAPWIIRVFYSSEFLPATALLQWFILGCLGRVISWPMGFIMLALAKSRWFFVTETLFNVLHLALIWVGLTMLGIEGIAIAFFVLYVGYIAAVYGVSRYLIRFSWSAGTSKLVLLLIPIVALAFVAGRSLQPWPATGFGILLTSVASILCLRKLFLLVGPEHRLVQISNRLPGMRWISGRS
jgi:antigen flippase